ncbi:hypothetical protein BASA50_002284 [Batrachochytrium salamandrivorans]|uniref:Protein kinase domain-containing protein n=1 Tax=Batrachochytrium salamandrivorans TaxID=1357716 RepID=A0ABQ8FN20_9FUNG|nr:hypothetical protein BASA60_003782 [Batrachochytrium salamandrivorans]KAH6600461.1 hypothetical protein BASA50_002284 [Batrachochytrium salamandrivorans]KAH6602175.1 hypothetical protein BASA61_001379 [Batrachochytrium salamandrivorans]KAH9270770.1 hypothetical protein BASA83_007132 [Batrachochytrium salamandrivorans]
MVVPLGNSFDTEPSLTAPGHLPLESPPETTTTTTATTTATTTTTTATTTATTTTTTTSESINTLIAHTQLHPPLLLDQSQPVEPPPTIMVTSSLPISSMPHGSYEICTQPCQYQFNPPPQSNPPQLAQPHRNPTLLRSSCTPHHTITTTNSIMGTAHSMKTPASFFEDGALSDSSLLFSPVSPVAMVAANMRSFRSLPDLAAWEKRLVVCTSRDNTPDHAADAVTDYTATDILKMQVPLSHIECNGLRAAVLATESNPLIARFYLPHTVLGIGGNGVVLGATRRGDMSQVAIKVIYKNLARAYNMCIPNEVLLLRSFSHPNIIEYIDDFEDAFYFYIVTAGSYRPWMPHSILDDAMATTNTIAASTIPETTSCISIDPSVEAAMDTTTATPTADTSGNTNNVDSASNTISTIDVGSLDVKIGQDVVPEQVGGLAALQTPPLSLFSYEVNAHPKPLSSPPPTATPTATTSPLNTKIPFGSPRIHPRNRPRNRALHPSAHPVSLRCLSQAGGDPFIMSYARSTSDIHAFFEATSTPEPVFIERASKVRSIFLQVARALDALHRHGWAHGDIKEENILIDHEMHVSLCDFGHTKPISAATDIYHHQLNLSNTSSSILPLSALQPIFPMMSRAGTLSMTPPELIGNHLFPRSALNRTSQIFTSNSPSTEDTSVMTFSSGFSMDIWALGLVLYSMSQFRLPSSHAEFLRGQLNLDGLISFPCEFHPHTDPLLIDLVQKMLTIDPAKRITSLQILTHAYVNSTQMNV